MIKKSGQQSCSGISLEDGWYLQCTAFKNQQVNLELSAISSDHNYCRVPSKQVESQSRLGVQECNKIIWLWTSTEAVSENNQTLRSPINAAKLVSISRRPDSIAVYESVWNKKVTWCRLQQIDPVCAPLWKRPTISNYKITPLFYFIVPQICRWKASWGTSQSLCLAERFLQSKATTASLNIYLRCWISFALFEDNMSVNSQLSNSNKDLTHKLTTLIALSYAFRASSL